MPCRTGLRTETSIVAETSQAFSTHHIAVLVGYGAHAVVPYLAFETCRQWRSSPRWVCPYRGITKGFTKLKPVNLCSTYEEFSVLIFIMLSALGSGGAVALQNAVATLMAVDPSTGWCGRTAALIKSGKLPDVSIRDAQKNYKKALEKGILKILSKMGISLLSCYHGAQIFEVPYFYGVFRL